MNANGIYEEAMIGFVSDNDGNLHYGYYDTKIKVEDETYVVDREMKVDKSRVRVHSVFPKVAKSNSLEKLLFVIDKDLENQEKYE